jgi:hypothetical protein
MSGDLLMSPGQKNTYGAAAGQKSSAVFLRGLCVGALGDQECGGPLHGSQQVEITVTRVGACMQRCYRCVAIYFVTRTNTGFEAMPFATTSSLLIPTSWLEGMSK